MKNKLNNIDNLDINSLIRKKTLKGIVIGTVFGGIAAGSIGVAAVILNAEQVGYTPNNANFTVTNAEEALNELYDLSSELVGKSKIIDLGTGTSFNLTSYEGYENFTIDNFIIVPESLPYAETKNNNTAYASAVHGIIYQTTFIAGKTYSNGVLTISVNSVKGLGSAASINAYAYSTPVCRAYLIK